MRRAKSDRDRLKRELNRRVLPYKVQDDLFALEKQGFELLVEVWSDPKATPLQIVNALQLGFRMRGWGHREAVARAVLHFCEHPKRQVRSVAVQLLVGIARMAVEYEVERAPSLEASKIVAILKKGLELGVDEKAASLARDYLAARNSSGR